MTIARRQQIDPAVTRWYHCITRCVRRAFLLDDGKSNRKEWLENRIEELADIFAVGVGGFSVMDQLRNGRLFGRFLAATRQRLQEVAGNLGMRRVANLVGCPAR